MSESATRYFATIIDGDHPLSDNDYVAGRISAVFRLIGDTDEVMCYGVSRDGYDEPQYCYVIRTTNDKYASIKKIINSWYPCLCEFDYPLENITATLPAWL